MHTEGTGSPHGRSETACSPATGTPRGVSKSLTRSLTSPRLLISLCALGLLLGLINASRAQAPVATGDAARQQRLQWSFKPRTWKVWTLPGWPESTLEDLAGMEHQLYNRLYQQDLPVRRVARLEQSLALPEASLTPQQRLSRLMDRFAHSWQQPANQRQRVDIGLLERRLFQSQFDQWPLEQRLAQLETATFGQVYQADTHQSRLNRLFEQVPLSNRAVRFVGNP
jgi:hypothetical protein